MSSQDLMDAQNDLLREAASGRSSRRDLLKRAVAAGLSAPAIAGVLAAYRPASVAAQTPAASVTDGDSALKGKTIDMTILGIAGWPPSRLGVDLATEMFKPYAKEKLGYDVNFSFEESPFDSLFQKAATSLQSGSNQYSVIISDSQWLGAMAEPGWIVKLNDIIAANPDLDLKFNPTAQTAYRIYPDGTDNLYGFPQEGDVIVLYVRQDLFSDQKERDAYKAANDGEDLPQTYDDWEKVDIDQYTRIAKFFTRPDEKLYGTALQWSKVYDFVSCYTYPFMFSRGGEIWDAKTGQVQGILDTDVNAQGLEMGKSFIQYAPPGATNFGIPEEVDAFTAGTLATCLQWAAVGPQMINQKPGAPAGELADPSKPIKPDQVLIVPPLGFKQDDGSLKRVYTVGGQPWVINAFNDPDQMQVAVDYMTFWYQPDTQLEFAKRGGNPCVQSVLDDPNF
ncbi:MAG TPA: extracellular solute-binding protein, partial [Thermomicrobiales bacterium]|nr:extracellular solute-binding protein [Thermomicrobiales bacterium]